MKSLEQDYYKYHRWNNRGGVLSSIGKKLFFLSNIIHASDISIKAQIGNNIRFGHRGIGIVIHQDAVIGDNVHIMQNVTIGAKDGHAPIIGDNVFIGVGAVILGGVTIGNNAQVGANAVVNRNVDADAIVGGVPAKALK